MFVTPEMIGQWEERYGVPREWSHHQPMSDRDHGVIKGSQRNGREHDITLYVEHQGLIAVIAKPFYPPGLYRAPSGGLNPGESLEEGAQREAIEETGLTIALRQYLLRTDVVFEAPLGRIAWHSHVFSATTEQTSIQPTDHHEIREARWAQPGEFATFGAIMRDTNLGGLHYRASLHEQIARLHPLFQR